MSKENSIPLEIKAVKKDKALSKTEIIRKIAKDTNMKQDAVEDVLNAFVDLYTVELLTTGAWRYPGMGHVERKYRKPTIRKNPITKEYTEYPETCYLQAKLSDKLSLYHRMIFRNINNQINGTTKDNWYKDRIISDYKSKTLEEIKKE